MSHNPFSIISNTMYRSTAFTPPRRSPNTMASSLLAGNTSSLMRDDANCFTAVSGLPFDHHPTPRQLYFDGSPPPIDGFGTPHRSNHMSLATPDDVMAHRSHHARTSPTSVLEFERFHEPNPSCARTVYHGSPQVSSPMAHFRSIHQSDPAYDMPDAEGNHPTPQNLRDNPERAAKIKTELCQFWIEGKKCPWGINCNFAHGEEELKFKYSTLLLMESSGQIANAYTYLCRPCLTFVSTGACPFGRRCTGIHDPRVQGPECYPSWLPMATSKTNAQIIVDPLAAHRETALHQENPLIPQSIWQHCRPSLKNTKASDVVTSSKNEFEDTYKLVCNTDVPVFIGNNERHAVRKSPEKMSELQKLCIVEKFRANQDRSFLYSPTHSLRGELCMILQTRYFCLDNEESGSGDVKENNVVREISLDEYRARTTPWSQTGVPYTPLKIIHAHEVAFAPKGDPTSNFSVWFDEEPIKLEQTQIKRSRRMKQKNKTSIKKGHTRANANGALIVRTSPVDFRSGGPVIEPFVYMIPAEDNVESNRLIDEIIKHRIDYIISSTNSPSTNRKVQDQALRSRAQQLKKSYEALNTFHRLWMCPPRTGLESIDFRTQAPPGNAITYTPANRSNEASRDPGNLWQGFVENMVDNNPVSLEHKSRLPIFHSLNLRSDNGRPIPRFPCFSHSGNNGMNDDTWMQLLLGQRGDWSNARELYEIKMRGSPPARNLPLSTIPFVQN